MGSCETTRLYALRRLIVCLLACGFLLLTLDVFLEHYFAVRSMKPAQWIPIPVGLSASAIAFRVIARGSAGVVKAFQLCSGLAVLVGGAGWVLHLAALWRTFDGIYTWQIIAAILSRGAPVFAPLSFAALGLLGLVLTSDRILRSWTQ